MDHGLQVDLSGFDGSLIEVLEAVDFRYDISRRVFPIFFRYPGQVVVFFRDNKLLQWFGIDIAPVLTSSYGNP